jgi:tetratricopeptide (TPR) repeat protein
LVDYFNLTILVYGVIQPGANGLEVQPVFFIPEQNKRFDYGREVGGANRLGRPIPVKPPFVGKTLATTNKLLTNRVKVLGHIILGLNHFDINRNEEAGEDFKRALNPEFWESAEGQDVIYVLAGAASLRNVGESRCAAQDRTVNLEKARTAFERALNLNPEYARSYLGLGAVYLEQARVYSGTKLYRLENDQLERAYAAYSNSLRAADQPPLAHVPEKADYGLGVVHTMGFLGKLPGWTQTAAETHFRQVIATRNPTAAPELEWFVGNAYAQICLLNTFDLGWRSDAGEAIPVTVWAAVEADCRQGIDILKDIPRNRPFLAETWRLVAFAAKKQDHFSDTCQAYAEAINLGQTYPDFCWPVAEWQNEQQQLGCQ